MDDYDDDDEVPYEFQDGYLSEWYGTSDDEELQDASIQMIMMTGSNRV